MWGLLFCLAPASQAPAQSLPTRFVVDTRAVCRSSPARNATAGGDRLVGHDLVATRSVEADGATWYLADGFSTPAHACWVYGPYTTVSREWMDRARNTEADWLAVLDHVIARTDVALEEYVTVDNLLSALVKDEIPGSDSALLRYRWLQMLDKAGGAAGGAATPAGSPLQWAWLASHLEMDPFGRDWYVPAQRYWDLFDANRGVPRAEEIAWTAVRVDTPRDECYSNCLLNVIVKQQLPYWKRLPRGAHIQDVLAEAAKLAQSAVDEACYERAPGATSQSPVPAETVAEIRDSLVRVAAPEKLQILRLLEEVERRCR